MHPTAEKLVALVGPPNAGKTTLFNWLSGSHYETVNYPGSTVEYSLGNTRQEWGALPLMDTPGTHSLFPKSQDEEVCLEALFRHPTLPRPKLLVVVVDATQLSRHLLLVEQLKLCGFSIIVALTMMDILKRKGLDLDLSLLRKKLQVPMVPINGQTGEGVAALASAIEQGLEDAMQLSPQLLKPWLPEQLSATMQRLQNLQSEVLRASGEALPSYQAPKQWGFERLDRWLLHPLWGLLSFVLIMTAFFSSIFWLAQPLMDAVDGSFAWLIEKTLALAPPGLWSDFFANGILSGLAAVLVFVPQILILFLGLSVLDASGYLARAASLVDRPLAKLGLNGRAFVPLLSGFACAIPAMMATRTIASRRERWLTLFILPLMSCSARLPVYALLLGFLLRGKPVWYGGLAMTIIYLGNIIIAAILAGLIHRSRQADPHSFFLLELPSYRRPQWTPVLKTATTRTLAFIKRAGPMILFFSILIWVGTSFPNYHLGSTEARLEQSYAAQLGHYLEPMLAPLGLDWRVGVGLIAAFAAREVFVSVLAVVLHVGAAGDELQGSLLKVMQEATTRTGAPLFTIASVVGLIVFFMIALQCMSTVVLARREFGSWRDALIQLVSFNVLAYSLAFCAVQGLRILGFA